MARIKLHSETFYGLNRDKLRSRLAALAVSHPGAEIKHRRLPRYGNGYTISVHGEGTPTRVQTRGHCQFCGNHQVVKDGVLVLHGYQRPGNGWIFGRCPGAGEKPLQVDETITRASLAHTEATLAKLLKRLPKVTAAATQAEAHYNVAEPGMAYAMPSEPYKYRATDAEKAEMKKAHAERLAKWYETHPATKAYIETRDAARALDVAISQAKGGIEHFNTLLGWKLLGTPLVEVEK